VNSGTPGALGLFGGGIPVGIKTEPGDGTSINHLNKEGAPGKIPRVAHAAAGGGGADRGVKRSDAVAELDSALWDTRVAVDDPASTGDISLPGGVRGGDTEADDLDVVGLGGAHIKTLKLSHTLDRSFEIFNCIFALSIKCVDAGHGGPGDGD